MPQPKRPQLRHFVPGHDKYIYICNIHIYICNIHIYKYIYRYVIYIYIYIVTMARLHCVT